MATKQKEDVAEKAAPAVEKRPISVCGPDGKYVACDLVACNRDAQAAIIGRRRREDAAMRHVAAAVKAAVRRT